MRLISLKATSLFRPITTEAISPRRILRLIDSTWNGHRSVSWAGLMYLSSSVAETLLTVDLVVI
jgi:hypothetical protein